jgi:hypothetical protein
LHAGIAGGGDVILLPEIKWNWDDVCHKILRRESQGKKFTLVVVAEGAHLPDGELVGEQRNGAQMKLGGIGRTVCDEIERRLQREVRLSVLGHLQRGGKPTTFDRVLATQYGAHAVRLVHQKKFGEMLCYQPPEMTSVPIMEAVNVLRRVDVNGAAVQAARALGISFGDRPVTEVGCNLFDKVQTIETVAAQPESVEEYTDEFTEQLKTSDAPVLETPVSEAQAEVETTPVALEIETVELVQEPIAVAETLAVEETAVVEETQPAAEETLAAAVTPLMVETQGEEEVAEEIADSLLDLVADADELIHGPIEVENVEVEAPETDELESDELETEESVDDADEIGITAPSVLEDELEETLTALSLDETEEVAEADKEPVQEAAAKLSVDLEAVQAELAERIAGAAKAKRDAAAVEEIAESEGLEVVDLVKQKLATVGAAAKPQAAKSVLDEPHGEDLIAEARAALEEALVK